MDNRVYGSIGAFFGFAITGILLKFVFTNLWLADKTVYMLSMIGAYAGLLLARFYLKHKRIG